MAVNSDQSQPRGEDGGPTAPAMAGDGRKPWSAPLVIVSDAKLTRAHTNFSTDGTSIHGYQYGS